MRTLLRLTVLALAVLLAATAAFGEEEGRKKGKKKEGEVVEDPYAAYVWPAPPNDPRIKLQSIFTGRVDLEGESRLKRALIGASPKSPYDRMVKPFAVAIDSKGRVLVTDSGTGALLRFDLEERRFDVLGTKGRVRLGQPLGMCLGPDDTAYVADVKLRQVVALDPAGSLRSLYGREGELTNPTDVALSPDGERLFVADSKAHQIVVFDLSSARLLSSFGRRGTGEGEFNFPTALAFGSEGELFVVDQLNARVQILTADGEYLDELGGLGVGFGNFVRPKDVTVDEVGFIYVVDNAFNNVQIFDADFSLLTFVGEGGSGPGQFLGASGVAVRGDAMVVVDQLGARLQSFRFLIPKTE